MKNLKRISVVAIALVMILTTFSVFADFNAAEPFEPTFKVVDMDGNEVTEVMTGSDVIVEVYFPAGEYANFAFQPIVDEDIEFPAYKDIVLGEALKGAKKTVNKKDLQGNIVRKIFIQADNIIDEETGETIPRVVTDDEPVFSIKLNVGEDIAEDISLVYFAASNAIGVSDATGIALTPEQKATGEGAFVTTLPIVPSFRVVDENGDEIEEAQILSDVYVEVYLPAGEYANFALQPTVAEGVNFPAYKDIILSKTFAGIKKTVNADTKAILIEADTISSSTTGDTILHVVTEDEPVFTVKLTLGMTVDDAVSLIYFEGAKDIGISNASGVAYKNSQKEAGEKATVKTTDVFTYKFVDEDGTVLKEENARYGDVIVAPSAPSKDSTQQYTYTFAGWEGFTDGMTLTANMTFTAEYDETVNKYSYAFVDEDGTLIKDERVDYGTVIELPATPADRDPYTFDSWAGYTDGMTVTEDVKFTATYKYKTYNITVDGYKDITASAVYGSKYTIDPVVKDRYEFKGYYIEVDGKVVYLTDEKGESIDVYDAIKDIVVYPELVMLVMIGDIDCDGAIAAADLTLLVNHLAGTQMIVDPVSMAAADIDNDGAIAAADLTLLVNHLAGTQEIVQD